MTSLNDLYNSHNVQLDAYQRKMLCELERQHRYDAQVASMLAEPPQPPKQSGNRKKLLLLEDV